MKLRSEMNAAEIAELRQSLALRLENVGLVTQPEVAGRILRLISDPGAQVREYARAIGTDPGLSGRLLKLVNSAAFGQNTPVTSLDRACALLGIEKLRSFSLGFYLCRASLDDPSCAFSRRVWGQSVFRACLSAELARRLVPRLVSEAFVIGLIMDCGLPLLPGVLGEQALAVIDREDLPSRIYVAEYRTLPVTHVDIAAALAKRWGLPPLLARPIELHHAAPTDLQSTDPAQVLHRIAYYAGAIGLEAIAEEDHPATTLPEMGVRVLGMDRDDLAKSVERACAEYSATSALFADVAETARDVELIAGRVHNRLLAVIEANIARSSGDDARRFVLGGFDIEVRRDDGRPVACIIDAAGNSLVCHRFETSRVQMDELCRKLGVEPTPGDQSGQIEEYLNRLAA